MLKALLGKKLGMTQIYDEAGTMVPVTVLEVGPCNVVQVKTDAEGRCKAVQIGFGERKRKRTTKPLLGHFAKAKVAPKRLLRDVEPEPEAELALGQVVSVGIFAQTPSVDVIAKSKGCGFTGVMKRHNFKGGPASHGASRIHRHGGSIGPGASPGRVIKGRKMAGHMGDAQVTVRNLKVVKVDEERGLLLVRGAVPGSKGSHVMVRKAIALRA